MLDNQNLRVRSDKVCLIPYCREHVDTYHEWMQDPYILEMTASEPLSLEEEVEMQQSWALDPKKATFIVVRPSAGGEDRDEMIGDVNLFFNSVDDPKHAEIDVMIAKEDARGSGMGREAVMLMLHFALRRLEVSRFYCKINEKNVASLRLFKSLNFVDVKYVSAFKEYELELIVEDATSLINSLENLIVGGVIYSNYKST